MAKQPTKAEMAAEIARLQAQLAGANEEVQVAKATSRGRGGKSRPLAPLTTCISMRPRPDASKWEGEYHLLALHGADEKQHPKGTRLRDDDEVGRKYVARIKEYAREHPVCGKNGGVLRVKFNNKYWAWSGPRESFPPEFREACGIK